MGLDIAEGRNCGIGKPFPAAVEDIVDREAAVAHLAYVQKSLELVENGGKHLDPSAEAA